MDLFHQRSDPRCLSVKMHKALDAQLVHSLSCSFTTRFSYQQTC